MNLASASTLIGSARLYHWPIIIVTTAAMSFVVGADVVNASIFGISLAFVASFGFYVNDLCDREIDRANRAGHLERASGYVIRLAISAAVVLLTLALLASAALGRHELGTSAAIAIAVLLYSVVLRRLILIPTVVTALAASSPVWSPLLLWAKGEVLEQWMLVLAGVLALIGRETLMDVRDAVGDALARRPTVTLVMGEDVARAAGLAATWTGVALFVACGVVSIWPLDNALRTTLGCLATVAVTGLLLIPSFSILRTSDLRASIDGYVLRSRLAMALMPGLVLALWWPAR